jgi:hypothetical protein
MGAIVQTPDGKGVVVDSNLLTGALKVQLDSKPDAAPSDFHRKDVKIIRDGAIRVAKEEKKALEDLEG